MTNKIQKSNQLNDIQMEIFTDIQLVQASLDRIVLKLQVRLKDLTISLIQRRLLEDDIRRIGHIKKELRDLSILHYNGDGQFPVPFGE